MLLDRIEAALEPRLSRVERSGSVIHFRGGPFRAAHSWDVFFAISRGKIEVVQNGTGLKIRYELRFAALFLISCLFASAVVWQYTTMPEHAAVPASVAIPLPVLMYGANVAIASLRFFVFLSGNLDAPA